MSKTTELVELESRVEKIVGLCDKELVVLSRHFVAILSVCDNQFNQHFAENALIFYTFVNCEIDALLYGYLPFEAQEKCYKGFISKQHGSFDRNRKKDSIVRLTSCCVENLNNEVGSNDEQLNRINLASTALLNCVQKLQPLADTIVSALTRKCKGKGFRFILNAKYYGGFKYSFESSADTDARGTKVPKVSDGLTLLKNAVDVQRRDLYSEISSLTITPQKECPHLEIVAAENKLIREKQEEEDALNLKIRRKRAENEIIAQKRDEERKRKRAEKLKAEEAARAAEDEEKSSDQSSKSSSDVDSPEVKKTKSRGRPPRKVAKQANLSDDEGEDDLGFTLQGYTGDKNDENVMRRDGRKKLIETGDLDFKRDEGYDDFDESIVKNLRGDADALKNFILRGGNVTLNDGGMKARHVTKSEADEEWMEPSNVTALKKKSHLDDLDLDDCDSPDRSDNKYLHSNFIDREDSSSEDSGSPRNRRNSVQRTGKQPVQKKGQKKTVRKASKAKVSKSRPTSRINQRSDSSGDSDLSSSSSESDAVSSKKRKKHQSASRTPKVSPEGVVAVAVSNDVDADGKPRKTRELVGLTEHQVVQFVNGNLVPFHMTPAQHRSVRSEQFEVNGQLMSDDDIANHIMSEAKVIGKNIDVKFSTFIRQHIMVEVFKDVHFMSNVIQFYRAKRHINNTAADDHLTCNVWQAVLKEVAADSINELVSSNQKILDAMKQNLLTLKEERRQERHRTRLVINDETEKLRNALDFEDLSEYKKQMKLSRTALEEIEKVMKRRINSIAHSTGAKIICIWAKLNNFRHLLSGNLSKFEKKFLLDPTMPFYSVLSDDLSSRWRGNVAASPGSLFMGMDIADTSSQSPRVRDESFAATSRLLLDHQRDETVYDASASEHQAGCGDPPADVAEETSIEDSDNKGSHITKLSRVRFNHEHGSEEDLTDQHMSVGINAEENETPPQLTDDVNKLTTSSFMSPVSRHDHSIDEEGGKFSFRTGAMDPNRPSKSAPYTSAMLRRTPDSRQSSQSSNNDNSLLWTSSTDPKAFSTPSVMAMVTSSSSDEKHPHQQRRSGMFSVSNRDKPSRSSSYLSSISSRDSSLSTSANSPAYMCESNYAVLFDELKHMNADDGTVEKMFRFIKVMNEKAPTSNMPATAEEEEKILKKAAAKKKREEAKAAAASKDTKKGAELIASALSTTDNPVVSLEDDEEAELPRGAIRLKTDSYFLFQKLFVFVCKKHVEVKDVHINLQFFGQRLVKSMTNSALLTFLLLLLRNKGKDVSELVIYLLDEKRLCAELNCIFGVAYKASDYFNIIGDGYCVLRSMFACFCNWKAKYKLSLEDMKAADQKLFKSKKFREEFYGFVGVTRDSINQMCGEESVKTLDKQKLRTTMTLFAAYPQLRQIPAIYWGCLDWVAYAQFNITAFSTNYSDCVPGYAQLHCSSALSRDMSMSVLPFSVNDIRQIFNHPANYCVLEGQHSFVIAGPSTQDEGVKSFQKVLSMFLEICLKSIADLVSHLEGVDLSVMEGIIEKMIGDNAYSLNEAEAKFMTCIVKAIDELSANVATLNDDVVLCNGNFNPPISLEEFHQTREGEGVVIDLCDSDTGDVDRTKLRSTRKLIARQEQELSALKLKCQTSERENTFLLRLIGKDSSLMHDPPLDIVPE